MARHKSPMHVSDSSEDEGRGASLPSLINSPLTGRRNKSQAVSHTIAAVVPPAGPPPPPPPPALLKPIENKVMMISPSILFSQLLLHQNLINHLWNKGLCDQPLKT